MRELQLWDADETVEASFADVTALADGCRFRDCLHDHEPGCAVKAAVASGAMDAERYAGYLKLQKEQAAVGRLRDVRAQLDAKRDAKAGSKAMKATEKERDRS